MCGRTCLSLAKEHIQCACSYQNNGTYVKPDWVPEYNDGKDYNPSYNIAPTDVTPVLISGNNFKNTSKSSRILKPMMWGIIPPWHKGDYKSHNIIEGFYEWQTTIKTTKIKQPYYIHAPQENGVKMDDPHTWINTYDDINGWKGINLLHMAGLYNVWQNENKIIYSYTVITMESNSNFHWLHHRMPAILCNQKQIEDWLDIENVPADLALCLLKSNTVLNWHPVSNLVNNSRNKSDECNKRVMKAQKSSQRTLNVWFTRTDKRKADFDNESKHSAKKLKE
ncbi:hypothetical protein ACJJTC_004121 [Scirpophaga incertulas]